MTVLATPATATSAVSRTCHHCVNTARRQAPGTADGFDAVRPIQPPELHRAAARAGRTMVTRTKPNPCCGGLVDYRSAARTVDGFAPDFGIPSRRRHTP